MTSLEQFNNSTRSLMDWWEITRTRYISKASKKRLEIWLLSIKILLNFILSSFFNKILWNFTMLICIFLFVLRTYFFNGLDNIWCFSWFKIIKRSHFNQRCIIFFPFWSSRSRLYPWSTQLSFNFILLLNFSDPASTHLSFNNIAP